MSSAKLWQFCVGLDMFKHPLVTYSIWLPSFSSSWKIYTLFAVYGLLCLAVVRYFLRALALHGGHMIAPVPWWRHQLETFSALLALCVGNRRHRAHYDVTVMRLGGNPLCPGTAGSHKIDPLLGGNRYALTLRAAMKSLQCWEATRYVLALRAAIKSPQCWEATRYVLPLRAAIKSPQCWEATRYVLPLRAAKRLTQYW